MQEFFTKAQSFYFLHKRLVIGALGSLVIVSLAILLLLPTSSSTTNSPNSSVQNQQTSSSEPKTSPSKSSNLLLQSSEVDQMNAAYAKKYAKSGKAYTVQNETFHYKLSPSLSDNKSSFLGIHFAFAANDCNVSSAPETVSGYDLLSHLSFSEASSIADTFSMPTDKFASIPNIDGVTFSYYFTNPATTAALSVSEPSAAVMYHTAAAVDNTKADISLSQAQAVVTSLLAKEKVDKGAVLKTSIFDTTLQEYDFVYEKKFDFLLTDTDAIKALGTSQTLCSLGPSNNVNFIETLLNKKGDVAKFVNQTRVIKSAYPLKRESLADAMKEYADHLPVPPIVVGTVPPGETVTVDEVMLVYYDMGSNFGQYTYVPMYLTSGKVGSGRVFTLFPAVSGVELDKTPLSETQRSTKGLQLQTFNPNPPPPSGKACFGNQVDYIVTCTQNSSEVCKGFFSLPTDGSGHDANDPFGVCLGSCQQHSDTFDVPNNSDACLEFLKREKLDTTQYSNTNKYLPNSHNANTSGTVSCQVQGCPC